MKRPISYFAIVCILAACSGRDAHSGLPQAPLSPLSPNARAALNVAPQTVSDGRYPLAALTNINGVLYGTTSRGSPYNAGVVFSLTTSGQERFPYRFQTGSLGWSPEASLLNITGERYGTTRLGGSTNCTNGCGTVFSFLKNHGYRRLYAFTGAPDGANPTAELIDVNGTLYGTTQQGGTSGYGTVFSVTTNGQESVLHSFAGGTDGRYPQAGLLNVNGTLYGTVQGGGGGGLGTACNGDCGIVFSITTSGQYRVLYRFQGGSDGAEPEAALISVNGTLYGTTAAGGGPTCGSDGCGTVFSITKSGVESVLHRFGLSSPDGAIPMAPLLNVQGTLYGTTVALGGGCGGNFGTVFSITTSGQVKLLYCFNGSPDGAQPQAGLVNVKGILYGTTRWGGTGACYEFLNGCGTVFSITRSGKEQVLHSF